LRTPPRSRTLFGYFITGLARDEQPKTCVADRANTRQSRLDEQSSHTVNVRRAKHYHDLPAALALAGAPNVAREDGVALLHEPHEGSAPQQQQQQQRDA